MKRIAHVIGLLLLCSWPALAQTPPRAVFVASSDHAVDVGGTPLVTTYQLDVMIDTATGALAFSKSLGKPTPNAQNEISVSLPEFVTLPNKVYVATVSAIGPGGTARSEPSDPFVWLSRPPAQPGKPRVESVAP